MVAGDQDYDNGPYILEEGWASAPTTTYLEVQGTNGTVLYGGDKIDPNFAFFGVRTGDDHNFMELPVKAADSADRSV